MSMILKQILSTQGEDLRKENDALVSGKRYFVRTFSCLNFRLLCFVKLKQDFRNFLSNSGKLKLLFGRLKPCMLMFFLLPLFVNSLFAQCDQGAFTHPLSDIKQTTSIYHAPNVYHKELKSDNEAGWEAIIKQKQDNYFQIDIPDLALYDIWIHIGDLGVVIQNYDSIAIPIYAMPNKDSFKNNYIYNSCIGLIYDIFEDLVFVQTTIDDKQIWGWVDKKYLCESPKTTCN